MKLLQEQLQHPNQGSRIYLRLFRQPEGFLLTEEWEGSTTVYKTLGLFDTEAVAESRVRSRIHELESQRFRRVLPAA